MLKSNGVAADVIITGNSGEILHVHRSAPGMEIYWLDNRSVEKNQAEVSFRVAGQVPELWHPETGRVNKVSWEIREGRTVIPLNFESWEAYFIVFNEPTNDEKFVLPATQQEPVQTLTGPWQVSFQPDRGAPTSATFSSLESWTENVDPGIRYFSGTATYQATFNWAGTDTNDRIWLDLGDVKNLAEVSVNGQIWASSGNTI